MGNIQETSFKEEKQHKAKCLCIIKDISDYSGMDDLLKLLSINKEKQVKIITVMGVGGSGKSTILNFILGKFTGQNHYIFNSYEGIETCTLGINYTTITENDMIYIFFDCQGFNAIGY